MTARPALEIADIFRDDGPTYRIEHAGQMLPEQHLVMRAIEQCRTSALGGHLEECDACGHMRIAYNSCGNRHCPKCQSLDRARWLEARQQDLLPLEYFHVVFTVPDQIAEIALQNKRLVYGILFDASAQTLQTIASDPKHLGAEIGFIGVLHTWGQTLQHHPHIHYVVPGGGLSPDGERFITCRQGFLLPVKVLSALFRRLFLEQVRGAFERGDLTFAGTLEPLAEAAAFGALMAEVGQLSWVVYAKPPFGGPDHVLEYLGRYTHRVAISNSRLVSIDDDRVSFRWKDYRHENRQKVMTLSASEFIRRFLLHVLPRGFQRIRHYGLLSNRHSSAKLPRCRQLLGAPDADARRPERLDVNAQYKAVTGKDLDRCPACGTGRMRVLCEVLASGPGARRGAWPPSHLDSS